jgi:hypothetical protein
LKKAEQQLRLKQRTISESRQLPALPRHALSSVNRPRAVLPPLVRALWPCQPLPLLLLQQQQQHN